MENITIHAVYFSPTGTTATVVNAVTKAMDPECETHIDLTQTMSAKSVQFDKSDLLVIGMPVYGGRLPALAVERFQQLRGWNTPVVIIAVYGNRAYEDALTELYDCCSVQGFTVVAAGAFIGQHSFSTAAYPIAVSRPDQQDLQEAAAFGRTVLKQILQQCNLHKLTSIPGNRPYKTVEFRPMMAVETNEVTCSQCGACATHCPVPCISMDAGLPQTDAERCLWCMACVQHCPTGARCAAADTIGPIAQRLYTACQTRRNPACFYT